MAKRAAKPVAQPLSDFRPLAEGKNPNKHTQQGMGQLDSAMSRHGFTTPMTAAADGDILDGNARLEKAGERFPGVDPIVIEHDGTRPIIAVRTDIASADDPLARDIIVSSNRISEANLDYDLAVLHGLAADGLDLTPYEFPADLLAPVSSGSGFSPSVEPTVGGSGAVTDAQVAATGERLTAQVTTEAPAIREVVCPHCGKDFGIEG